jgi:DNA-binding transcriptional LysR family regulator
MDLRQLGALVAVADYGTFSEAARRLHTVQSNVSTHIARLERELGVTLVDRAAGRLTDEGTAAVERARRIQAEVDALVSDLASIGDHVTGSVRLGVIGTTARWLVPRLLVAMRTAHPRVQVVIVEATTTSLVPQLVTGRLDAAVINLPCADPDVVTEPLFEEDLVLIAPPGHPLADEEEIDLRELAGHPLLLEPPGTSFRDDLDKEAARAGITLEPLAELDGLRLVASLAFEGFGAAIVPATAAPGWLSGDWRRVAVRGLAGRHVGLARRRRGLLAAPARAMTETLNQVILEQGADQPGVVLARSTNTDRGIQQNRQRSRAKGDPDG